MHLQQGAPGGTLLDGNISWNPVTEGALGLWNPFLSGMSFRVVRDSTEGIALRNGVNNVFWDDDICGDSFGDAIAYTRWIYRASDNIMIEADVIFNRGKSLQRPGQRPLGDENCGQHERVPADPERRQHRAVSLRRPACVG